MGTLESCPMWDIYEERQNLSQEYRLRKLCFSDRSTPYNVTNGTPNVTPVTFSLRKMDYGLWNNSVRTDPHPYETWLIHTCVMTHSYVCHDSFLCVTWLIHMCDMTHSYETWLIHMCDMTHSYETWLIHTKQASYSCDYVLQVSFAEILHTHTHTHTHTNTQTPFSEILWSCTISLPGDSLIASNREKIFSSILDFFLSPRFFPLS